MSIKIRTTINIHIPYTYKEDKNIVANENELSRSAKVEFDMEKIKVNLQKQLNLHSKDLHADLEKQLKKRLNTLKGVKIK